MTNNEVLRSVMIVFLSICLIACGEENNAIPGTTFGVFKVIDANTIEMNGEIDRSTLNDFNELIELYPSVNKINIEEILGSDDDEVNLQVSAKVHQLNIATYLMDNGLIASGGVDFFLAGTTRTKGSNTQIGVHSWSDGTNDATDFPKGDANHQPYIDYYKLIGFTQTEAEAFYYFTINAASAASIHWMTEEEITQYKVLKP